MVGELLRRPPPAHVGVAAGPVVVQGGDYFGRTVNLASRVAGGAQAGQVLVTEAVAAAVPGDAVAFSDLGELRLKLLGPGPPARGPAVVTPPAADRRGGDRG